MFLRMSTRVVFALFLFMSVLLSLGLSEPQEPSDSNELSELMALQSLSHTGIVRLNDDSVSRFLTSVPTPRPYSLVILFDFARLHSDPNLQLSTMLSEYSLLVKSFVNNRNKNVSQGVFFCDLEYSESNSSFVLFWVKSLPHLRIVLPHVTSMNESDSLEQPDNTLWQAEHMAEFVESTTGIVMGRIARPPRYSTMQITAAAAITLITVPFAIYKIIRVLHNKASWLVGATSVYFFGVSGLMFNVIRKMPMYFVDQRDPQRVVFFAPGPGRQSGVESLTVGLLYTVVGMMLAGITHGIVKVENRTTRQAVMLIAMIGSTWAVRKVVVLDNWKTGYGVSMFWPSRWN